MFALFEDNRLQAHVCTNKPGKFFRTDLPSPLKRVISGLFPEFTNGCLLLRFIATIDGLLFITHTEQRRFKDMTWPFLPGLEKLQKGH